MMTITIGKSTAVAKTVSKKAFVRAVMSIMPKEWERKSFNSNYSYVIPRHEGIDVMCRINYYENGVEFSTLELAHIDAHIDIVNRVSQMFRFKYTEE
jgi:hypothetical protein